MQNPIIIVDDTEIVVQCLATILQVNGFSEVKSFTDPREAFRFIERNGRPGFIVADFDMPGMNGVELLDAVAALYPEVEGTIVTGNSSRLSGMKKYPVIPKDTVDFYDLLIDHIGSRVKRD